MHSTQDESTVSPFSADRYAASVPDDSTPQASPSPARVPTPAEVAAASRRQRPRRRAVIAEDEALIRLDLRETLEELGFDVVGEAADGAHAVELAAQLRPDVVVLDVKMPVLDGITAARQITSQRIAPVVILTAFSQRDLIERARDAGALAYLVKPFNAAELLPAIEIATSRHAELLALEREVTELSERLETRKIIERAKGVLQTVHGWSEPEAFRWIQRTAMNERVPMRDVAERVLRDGRADGPTSS
ncbi:response regulator receiver and ANTAR domain protein [Acidothermus cellulolyticus 11B]|uniref:Response regulator receiver and ANTAR domain protein n=1 Tax=Acidothermus cellulolyticus (strain ATCC 43068 / DSM 8971 / 11B) TaxID=351607 RepID=A0LTU3_ACIC1|nr:response regulator receiver and ANTAR domain protein [Acidothermus cellulolyticus 11B]